MNKNAPTGKEADGFADSANDEQTTDQPSTVSAELAEWVKSTPGRLTIVILSALFLLITLQRVFTVTEPAFPRTIPVVDQSK
ncbi:MAG: hypothetical protein HQL67_05910 [Magnetococcales bacterium]|nr:hypothetical protein [Magnetococcales bacterium]